MPLPIQPIAQAQPVSQFNGGHLRYQDINEGRWDQRQLEPRLKLGLLVKSQVSTAHPMQGRCRDRNGFRIPGDGSADRQSASSTSRIVRVVHPRALAESGLPDIKRECKDLGRLAYHGPLQFRTSSNV